MKELKQQNKNRRQINKDIQKKEIKKKCWLDDMKELKVKKGQLKWKYLFFSTRKKKVWFDWLGLWCFTVKCVNGKRQRERLTEERKTDELDDEL